MPTPAPAPTEATLWRARPAWRAALLLRWRVLFFLLALATLWWWRSPSFALPFTTSSCLALLLRLALASLPWLAFNLLDLSQRSYSLTPTRARTAQGIFSRTTIEAPLATIQHAAIAQPALHRILGIGDILISTAGVDAPPLSFYAIKCPQETLSLLFTHMPQATRKSSAPPRIPVIGLVGGIGAGKSAVAQELERLGCLVIDSDKDAKAMLTRADVRATLVSWWGNTVLDESGAINRARVADIIFNDPAQRTRLESLIHPLVKADRARAIAQAAAAGRTGVVIDAPLLFEAGSDKECDAVIYVDAPEAVRLARVQSTRGWSANELHRRESGQLPLAEKKSRATHTLTNEASLDSLRHQVQSTWRAIQSSSTPPNH